MGYPEVRRILAQSDPDIDDLLEALDFLATDRGYLLCLVNRHHIPDDGTADNRLVPIGLVKAKIKALKNSGTR